MSDAPHDPRHRPVMLAEVLATLTPRDGETIVDGTFGAGGYTRAILTAANVHVFAFDRDPDAIREAAATVAEFAARLTLIHAPFSEMDDAILRSGLDEAEQTSASPRPDTTFVERSDSARTVASALARAALDPTYEFAAHPPHPPHSSPSTGEGPGMGEGLRRNNEAAQPPHPNPPRRRRGVSLHDDGRRGGAKESDSDRPETLFAHGLVDAVVLDIGVSSMQIDRAERGFSFQSDGPLDMRMSQTGRSAADIVNETEEAELADIFFKLGEERQSRRIARAICADRGEQPFTTTRQLAGLVERVLGRSRDDKKHPATRTFQALRIAVNDELGELRRGLVAAERMLKPGGRLVVVTFHSEEDRIVKRFLSDRSGKLEGGSRHRPQPTDTAASPRFRIVNPRPLTPSSEEIAANPRARSAKLRAAVRTVAPPSAASDRSGDR